MSKIVPLGGQHKTAHSLFAELMNNPDIKKCAVVTMHEDGSSGFVHLDMSLQELCFAATLIQSKVALAMEHYL